MPSESLTKASSTSPRAGLLERAPFPGTNPSPTFLQREVDQLVVNAVQLASNGKTMFSLFAAGLAGRFARLGTLSVFRNSPASFVAQGFSQTFALASESAVFTSLERGFARLEGHAPTQSFPKAWASAAISLGSIKLLGGAARGQNLVVQHLLVDGGMVAGHQGAYALGLTERPQGSLARQMIGAEAMNLGMKGALLLLQGLSPRLFAIEQSLDLVLKFPKKGGSPWFLEILPQGVTETVGGTGGDLKAANSPFPARALILMAENREGPQDEWDLSAAATLVKNLPNLAPALRIGPALKIVERFWEVLRKEGRPESAYEHLMQDVFIEHFNRIFSLLAPEHRLTFALQLTDLAHEKFEDLFLPLDAERMFLQFEKDMPPSDRETFRLACGHAYLRKAKQKVTDVDEALDRIDGFVSDYARHKLVLTQRTAAFLEEAFSGPFHEGEVEGVKAEQIMKAQAYLVAWHEKKALPLDLSFLKFFSLPVRSPQAKHWAYRQGELFFLPSISIVDSTQKEDTEGERWLVVEATGGKIILSEGERFDPSLKEWLPIADPERLVFEAPPGSRILFKEGDDLRFISRVSLTSVK